MAKATPKLVKSKAQAKAESKAAKEADWGPKCPKCRQPWHNSDCGLNVPGSKPDKGKDKTARIEKL